MISRRRVFFGCCACAVLTSCHALLAALPEIIAVVTDAMLVLDQIQAFVDRYFKGAPNPPNEATVRDAMARARAALQLVNRAALAAEDIEQKDYDAAIKEFEQAYNDLLIVVNRRVPGLRIQRQGDPPMMLASEDELIVPEPIAIGYKLRRR